MLEFFGLKRISNREKVRNSVAKEIKIARKEEQRGSFIETNRSGKEYVEKLRGVKALFDYVRTLPSHTVLDIGAGTTRAIRQLAQSEMGQGLTFEVTVLTNGPGVMDEDSENSVVKVHVTSAEVLRGIPDNAVGAILALYSIAYSEAPEIALRRIDQVLVPGGVIKATFYSSPSLSRTAGVVPIIPSTHHQFYQILKQKGYDVKILRIEEKRDVLLAVKPGGSMSAEELIRADLNGYEHQALKPAN